MKILHLTLKKHWFDLIASGKKTREYREYKKYWHVRLVDKNRQPIIYDEIHFSNGYSSTSPFMRVRHAGTWITNGCDDLKIKSVVYCINLGEILEVKNWGGNWKP